MGGNNKDRSCEGSGRRNGGKQQQPRRVQQQQNAEAAERELNHINSLVQPRGMDFPPSSSDSESEGQEEEELGTVAGC